MTVIIVKLDWQLWIFRLILNVILNFIFFSIYSYIFMNSSNQWKKYFSEKNKMHYYFNITTHASLWVVDGPEDGWGRSLLDPGHPERGEKFTNIFTGKTFYSEASFRQYINSLQDLPK